MKARWRVWLGWALVVIGGGSLFLPAVHWRLIGWARGDAFFKGRPTIYWERELRDCEMIDSFLSGDLYFFAPEPSPLAKWLHKYLGVDYNSSRDPSRETRDPAAVQVLIELLACDDVKVQLAAIQTLGLLGDEAGPALPRLRELAQSTREYLVYREAKVSLGLINGNVAEEAALERPDATELWERYKAGVLPRPFAGAR